MSKILNNRYEQLDKLGEGGFSKVFKVKILPNKKDLSTDTSIKPEFDENFSNENLNTINMSTEESKLSDKPIFAAAKKLKAEAQKDGEGFNIVTLREIKILKELSYHPNIIKLYDVFVEKKKTILVIELMKLELLELIYDKEYNITEADVKAIMKNILEAIYCLSQNSLIHRDMTSRNILLGDDGAVKLSDFGSSRYSESSDIPMTPRITTRAYRSPEMLYGSKFYTSAVDIWGAGCIMAEMFKRAHIFPGVSDIDQLTKVFQLRGTPDENTWPELLDMPTYIPFEKAEKVPFSKIFPDASAEAVDLLENLLEINPNNRISIENALDHPFFKSGVKIEEATYQNYVKSYVPKKKSH